MVNCVFITGITSYEIPSGHSNYGPPSKPPTYSSATHQYLPPSGSGGYTGGGAGFSGGHVAFEAPSSNYLPTAYGPDGAYKILFLFFLCNENDMLVRGCGIYSYFCFINCI